MIADGIEIGNGDVAYALSITDVLPMGMMAERLVTVMGRSAEHPRLRFVCVRNDSRDSEVFAAAVSAASNTGLGLILESADPACLAVAAAAVPDRAPLMCVTDPDRLQEAATVSSMTGCPLAVPGSDVQSLMDNAEAAEAACGIVLNPSTVNMKSCLETCTDVHRLRSEHGILPDAPLMVRSWSGEYALAVASVAVMRGGDLLVLDDLDDASCKVLEALIGEVRVPARTI